MTARPILRCDFETRSTVELRTRGVYVYAASPTTDVWCMGYAFGDGDVQLWRRGEPCPPEVAEHVLAGGEMRAFNAAFERIIWRDVMGRRYGWPVPRTDQWRCTMVQGMAMALPGSLENMAPALGLDVVKDMAGKRLSLQMARPRAPRKGDPPDLIRWWDEPDKLERLYAYCRQDVTVEREVDRRTLPLSPTEQRLWVLDQEINDRGVFIDQRLCHAARTLVAKVTDALDEEMRAVTDGAIGRCSNAAELTTWVRAHGIDADSIRKDALADILIRDDLPPAVRRALELRQEAAKTSTAKIDKMLLGIDQDSRARGLLQFHAANTGRWGGRRVQPQNFPRPTLVKSKSETDADEAAVQRLAVELIHRGDPALIEMLFGAPLTVVADCIRAMVAAPKGRAILSGDFAAIEGRGVAWLAGQDDVLAVFASGADIYQQQAGGIFGVPPAAIGKGPKRQIGKVSILALGYGGGVGAFLAMARTYMLKIGDHYDEIWGAARDEHREKAREAWLDRGCGSGVAERTWLAAEVVKVAWRAANPKIVQLWRDLEDAAIAAVREPGSTHTVGFVKFKMAGSFLWAQLPSGRCLCYPYPKIAQQRMPWTDRDGRAVFRPQLRYRFVDQFTKQWAEGETYGGALAENCLAGDTPVLTDRGWVALADVRRDDALWDGLAWVRHGGVVAKGVLAVVDFGGILLTSDHKVLSREGWRHAEDARYEDCASPSPRLDGLRFWSVDAAEPIRQPGREDILAGHLRLRERGRSAGVRGDAETRFPQEIVRVCDEDADRGVAAHARDDGDAALRRLASHDRPMRAAFAPGLAQLRGPRDSSQQRVDQVRGILRGHGPDVPPWAHAGPARQQRPVLESELPLGHPGRTGEQQAGQRDHRDTARADDRGAGREGVRAGSDHDPVPDRGGLAGEPAADSPGLHEPRGRVAVFDIVNAGPRHRFTVRGADGRQVVVSNCTQAVARDLMAEAMLRADEAGYSLVLTVHDELVSDDPEDFGSAEDFRRLMEIVPPWAEGFPIAASVWRGARYRK